MLIDTMESKAILFFFAHQDDEFGIYHLISESVKNGYSVWCIYLTDGGRKSSIRNLESLNVLTGMGVCQNQIFFKGSDLGIPDLGAADYLVEMSQWCSEFLEKFESIEAMYVPALEGGHSDHDALHAAVVFSVYKAKLENRLYQFPLYNAKNCRGPFYKVMSPISENGSIHFVNIPFRLRLCYLRKCVLYSSQMKTWIGLFPFAAFAYLVVGKQFYQNVQFERIWIKPHKGELYYEKRKFLSWETMKKHLLKLRNHG